MKTLFSPIFAVLIVCQTSFGQDHPEKKWSYSLGLGTIATPSYLGDDNYQMMVLPNLRISYSDKFFASLYERVGYNLIQHKNWNIGPVVRYNFGRNEDGSSPLRIAGSKTEDLVGLGDIDFTVEPGGFVEKTCGSITTKFELRQGFGGHKGLIGELKSEYRGAFNLFNNSVYYSIGPEIKFANSNYNSAFFGVNDSQSVETGLSPHNPKFGTLSYGLNGSLVIPTTDNLSVVLFAGYNRLGDAATDSHIIIKYGSANQVSFGLLFNYTF